MLRTPICVAVAVVMVFAAASALAGPVPIGVGGLPRAANEEDASTAKDFGLNFLHETTR